MSQLNTDRVNNRVLLHCFCRRTPGLHIVHMNCQSARGKMDQIVHLIKDSQIDVLCLSETWLSSEITNLHVRIDGYKNFRQDRPVGRGGGVAIFTRLSLNARLVEALTIGSSECLAVEISTLSEKMLIVCAYNPHRDNDIEPLFGTFNRFSSMYNNIIVVGDLNKDLLKVDSVAERFRSEISGAGLQIVNDSEPTHFSHGVPSLIDVFLTAYRHKVLFFNQFSVPGISSHDLIFLTYDMQISVPHESHLIVYRDYKRVNLDELGDEMLGIPWDAIYTMPDVNNQVDFLNNNISYLFEKYVPLRSRTSNSNPPWFNGYILRLISERDYLYYVWRRNRSVENRERFRRLRNLTKTAIRTSKVRYYYSKLDVNLPPKQLWLNLRELGISNSDRNECQIEANILGTYFSTASNAATSSTPSLSFSPSSSSSPSPLHTENAAFNDIGFSFRGVTSEEIWKAAFSITSNAIGADNIAPRFIKLILPIILPFLTHIYNSCITTSTFPSIWKSALVIPVPKNKRASAPEDFRPISIIPYLSKIFEKLLNQQMMKYVADEDLLVPWQSGFRPGHSCTSALLKVTDDIRTGIDSDMATILVLLDFSKAFDSVDHSILSQKLRNNFNFSNSASKLIYTFLTDRSQTVRAKGGLSQPFPILSGAPQGSILSSSLFSFYINDLPSCLKFCNVHMYADDVQIYLSRRVGLLEDCVSRINEDLRAISAWAGLNRLALNSNKTQSMVVYKTPVETNDLSPILLGETTIPYVRCVRNLGIYINHTLSWEQQVNSVVGKVYGGLRCLWLSAPYTPQPTRLRLIKTLLLPLIMFGVEVYGSLDAACARKLNVAFNACVRYIFNLRRSDHISSFSSTLLGCNLNQYIKYRTVTYLFNLIKTRQPKYLYEKLDFAVSARARSLILPRFTVLQSRRSFFVHAISLWNMLPLNVRRTDNLAAFKRGSFEFFRTT